MTILLLILYSFGIFPETASTIIPVVYSNQKRDFRAWEWLQRKKEDECSIDGRNKMAAVFPVSTANV